MTNKRKLFIVILLLIFILIFGFGIKTSIETIHSPINTELENKETTLFFVGDIMLARGVEKSVKKNLEHDYGRLFENLPELKDADILFGNLEGPVSDKGNNVGSKYSFRMEPITLSILKDAGFDIFSFANNHVGDWNMSAFKDTLSRLKEIDILQTGSIHKKEDITNPIIIEKNGIKFGFLGFSDVGPNWIETKNGIPGIVLARVPNFKEIIQVAKTKCDILIISFHWGEEYKTIHNKRQEELAHTAIDNGADLIIGHHPHVMQDIEEYKGKPIVYSLGNFIFDQYFSKETMRGMLFSATFDGKNLIETSKKIITLNKEYQPEGIFFVEEIKERDEIAKTGCPVPKKDYPDMKLLNIGQKVNLPDTTYIPKRLALLDRSSSIREYLCLTKETKDFFESLTKDARKDGLYIKASSGFRSYAVQKIIFDEALKKSEDALVSIAKPGHSEHQLGTAVDLTGSSIRYSTSTEKFDNTPESKWLEENAYLYGFVQSYPKDKEITTGYKYEPWHYRYIGVENAKEIKESGLTITEFLK